MMDAVTATLIVAVVVTFTNGISAGLGAWINNARFQKLEKKLVRLETIIELTAKLQGLRLPPNEEE